MPSPTPINQLACPVAQSASTPYKHAAYFQDRSVCLSGKRYLLRAWLVQDRSAQFFDVVPAQAILSFHSQILSRAISTCSKQVLYWRETANHGPSWVLPERSTFLLLQGSNDEPMNHPTRVQLGKPVTSLGLHTA